MDQLVRVCCERTLWKIGNRQDSGFKIIRLIFCRYNGKKGLNISQFLFFKKRMDKSYLHGGKKRYSLISSGNEKDKLCGFAAKAATLGGIDFG